MRSMPGKTLYDKIWDAHVVAQESQGGQDGEAIVARRVRRQAEQFLLEPLPVEGEGAESRQGWAAGVAGFGKERGLPFGHGGDARGRQDEAVEIVAYPLLLDRRRGGGEQESEEHRSLISDISPPRSRRPSARRTG